jgi:thiamine-phosphate pyrophosphorylase
VLTDRRQAGRPLVDVVRSAVDGGARAVVLREKDLPAGERCRLADALRAVLQAAGGRLIVAAGGAPVPSDATHLPARAPLPEPRPALLGRSCHGLAEVAAASAEGVDYLTVSPVFATRTKPGYGPPLELAGLRRLAGMTSTPVYALGGVSPGNAAACRRAGATGVAVLGEVMRSADPASMVRRLVAALAEAGHD